MKKTIFSTLTAMLTSTSLYAGAPTISSVSSVSSVKLVSPTTTDSTSTSSTHSTTPTTSPKSSDLLQLEKLRVELEQVKQEIEVKYESRWNQRKKKLDNDLKASLGSATKYSENKAKELAKNKSLVPASWLMTGLALFTNGLDLGANYLGKTVLQVGESAEVTYDQVRTGKSLFKTQGELEKKINMLEKKMGLCKTTTTEKKI